MASKSDAALRILAGSSLGLSPRGRIVRLRVETTTLSMGILLDDLQFSFKRSRSFEILQNRDNVARCRSDRGERPYQFFHARSLLEDYVPGLFLFGRDVGLRGDCGLAGRERRWLRYIEVGLDLTVSVPC